MVQPMSGADLGSSILEQVHEDMTVYDREGHKIGTVEDVYLGSVSEVADEFGTGAATSSDPDRPGSDSFIEDIAEVFTGKDDMPEALRSRLLRKGYMRIDSSGLFAADRYATPDQVASVTGDEVHLSVSRDELIEA